MQIVFDIETVVDRDYIARPDFWEEHEARYSAPKSYRDILTLASHRAVWDMDARRSFALSPETAKVVAIAWGPLWSDHVTDVASYDDESGVLLAFAKNLPDQATTLIGFNIRDFDVPMISARCALHGVELPRWWPTHDRDYRHVADIRDILRRGPLASWLRRFELPEKTAHGAQVEYMSVNEARGYCRNDVAVERLLAQRLSCVSDLFRERR